MQPCQGPLPPTPLNELQLQRNLHCGNRGSVPLLCAPEPVPLVVRFLASLRSDSAFSATSRGSAPSLIPLTRGWPPGSPAAGEFRSHSHTPVALFHSRERSPIPSRTDRRGAPDSPGRRSSGVCKQQRPWAADAQAEGDKLSAGRIQRRGEGSLAPRRPRPCE